MFVSRVSSSCKLSDYSMDRGMFFDRRGTDHPGGTEQLTDIASTLNAYVRSCDVTRNRRVLLSLCVSYCSSLVLVEYISRG